MASFFLFVANNFLPCFCCSWKLFAMYFHAGVNTAHGSCCIANGIYTFESVQFPGVYLRMDGNGVTALATVGGTVNCHFGALPWEMFKLNCVDTTSCSYSIESVAFPGVYLRMDGNGVTAPGSHGGGTVNCHFGAVLSYEKFKLEYYNNGAFSIQSVQFPGVYLRMDGNGVTALATVGGTVNCQYGDGPYEMFKLRSA